MAGLGIFTVLIVGALAGWIAEKLTRSDHSLIMNCALGIGGAVLGTLIASLFGVRLEGFWGVLIAAIVGATLLIVIFRAVMRRNRTA